MTTPAENVTSRPMIVTTTENIPDTRVVSTIGQVFGLTVRSRSIGGNIAALLKSLVGGENPFVRKTQRRLQAPSPRPYGTKRRRHGRQRGDDDAI